MHKRLRISLFFTLIFPLVWGKYSPNWSSLDKRPLPDWYDKAKVGIFIHWGVFSVPSFGSEWFWANWQISKAKEYVNFMQNNFKPNFTYPEFASRFTAEFFNPEEWAEIFNASGARYVVLTSKHHEGYTLWPSATSWNWNVKDIGPKRDLLGDLASAIRKKTDIRFGVYHSFYEWFNPLYLKDKEQGFKTQNFVKLKTMPELVDLIETYRPEVIWSDGDWEANDTYWNSQQFLAYLYNDSPVRETVVANDRWGSGIPCKHGGFYTCSDRYNPKTLQNHKFENAMTIDKKSWGYRREASISDYMTTHELIQTMAETVSCGGNILINIGPAHDGRIVPIMEERLRDLGTWLKVNGESIYETTPWVHQNDTFTPGVWYTSKKAGNAVTVYAIVLNWPENNVLSLGSLQLKKSTSISMLGTEISLKWAPNTTIHGIDIAFPNLKPGQLQWAWVLKTTLMTSVRN